MATVARAKPGGWRRADPAWLRPAVHAALALPLLWLAYGWAELLWIDPASLRLSAEPVAYSQNFTGIWAYRVLLLSLAATPANRWLKWTTPLKYRRALGLWAFAYALAHFLFYWGLDQLFGVDLLLDDVAKRPFILLGMIGLLTLLPLAATSTRAAIKALGGRKWQRLHAGVYIGAVAVAVHFVLRVKGFQPEPWIYAGILGVLLLARVKLPQRR
jgi:sulfoxide reductase heme-binding subunit YedZ